MARVEINRKGNGVLISRSLLLLLSIWPCVARASQSGRSVTVDDVIGMTRLADVSEDDQKADNAAGAKFSPNGKHFVIVVRRGDVVANVNEFSMYLFETATAG